MWPLIRRWRDWAMNELWPMSRVGLQAQTVHVSYEKAGLVVADQPIPWNAEAVLIEANLRLPPSAGRRKAEFTLRCPGLAALPAEQLRKQDNEEHYRLQFRLPPPGGSRLVELLYRDRLLGQIRLPFLSRDEFLQGLRLQMPTVYVRMNGESVACRTFVTVQSRGLLASVLVTSPTSLAPLADLDLVVELRSAPGTVVGRAPARLSSSQLNARQALLTVVPGKLPRRTGLWSTVWLLGNRELASQTVRGISLKQFHRSLRVSDTRFVVQNSGGVPRVSRQPPAVDSPDRIGPCFLLSSGEAGMAGACSLKVIAQVTGAVQGPLLFEQDVLITDGPTMVAPGTLDRADLKQMSAFELQLQGKTLGILSLQPAPSAVFNAEGGFTMAQDYNWSPAAEEEMNERLNRLLDGP
jgi:hypothetical protein